MVLRWMCSVCCACYWCYEHGTVGRTSLPLHSIPTTTCLKLKRKKRGIVVIVKSKTELIIVNSFIIKCFDMDKTILYSMFHLYLPVLSQNEVFLSVSVQLLPHFWTWGTTPDLFYLLHTTSLFHCSLEVKIEVHYSQDMPKKAKYEKISRV